MESAETTSAFIPAERIPLAEHKPPSLKSSRSIPVLPEAVGPKTINTGGGTGLSLEVKPEFNFLGKNLPRRKGDNLAVVVFDFFVFQHGKLVAPA
jgi:hypothetical protein